MTFEDHIASLPEEERANRAAFYQLVGHDEYRRLLLIAKSCHDDVFSIMQELYHEAIAAKADESTKWDGRR